MTLKIGTRGSRLALAQSGWVKKKIKEKYPDLDIALISIKTRGDKIIDSPLAKIGGKGLFVKEIEDALIRREIDIAVHSIKDVPAELPEGLHIPIFPEREDPRDALLSEKYSGIDDLSSGASVGTGSLRRSSQLLHMRPDLEIIPIRGNVDTRIKKMESGDVQAIILAAAGLIRLGFSARIRQVLPSEVCLPAAGQGALGLEVRSDDRMLRTDLSFLNHGPTEIAVRAERAFLKELGGGCQVPVAAYCFLDGASLTLEGMVAELNGKRIMRDKLTERIGNPEKIGYDLARRLLDAGADEILEGVYGRE